MTEFLGLEPEKLPNNWEINLESPEITYLRERYSHIPDEQFGRMIRSSQNILSKCPNPTTRSAKATALAIGKIQSGKTLSFTSLIGLAANNNYGIIIVLAGTKVSLLDQTYQRLRKDLGINHPQNISRIYAQRNPTPSIVEGVTNALESGRCALFVVLKHPSHIDDVRKLVGYLPKKPVLIIDDEGDEASLNNYFKKGSQSATYASITNLRAALGTHAYVAYTATPQAPLFLDDIDELSPDFCELIEPGAGYCGGSEFFGSRIDNYIRAVNDVNQQVADDGQIPNSLKDALAIFFVGAVIRHSRVPTQRHSMLIHLSHRKTAHSRTQTSIVQLLRHWKDRLKLRPEDNSRIELMNIFRRAYDDLSTTVNNIVSWDAVQKLLLRELSACEVHMVNSLPQGVQIAETTFQLENNIVIGGNILGRGLTIQELAVSYMARRAKGSTNADTVEQRARWFGYKRSYLDLCRIFIPGTIRHDYQGLLVHEDDFWDSLRRNQAQEIPLRQWPRMFRMDTSLGMNPTRSSVVKFRRFLPTEWEIQRKPITDQTVVENNKRIIDSFFQKHSGKSEAVGGTTHRFVKNCPIHDAIKLIQQVVTPSETGWDSAYITEYLERLSFQGEVLPSIEVVLMAEGKWRERQLEPNGTINQLMQGPRANYPGDRDFHNNKAQLQIHYVHNKPEDKSSSFSTTALAIYIPNQPEFNLSFIVRGENP